MSTSCIIRITDENGITVPENTHCRQRFVSPPPTHNRSTASDFFLRNQNCTPLKAAQIHRACKDERRALEKQ